ncbi:hypothetical protein B0H14DRAFT_2724691 [Mycena olivaceomarginata]|nr:hypothetical protein B0H14DRAFT_2724691 [Mycena olivaceomarginata]
MHHLVDSAELCQGPIAFPESPPLLDFIHHLRTSNDVPLDSQTPLGRDIISDGQNQIQALNSQISDLEAAVSQLTQRRDGIAEYVRQHRTILSPVRRVPPKLVCEILELSLYRKDDKYTANRLPWYLGHIC